MRLFDCAGLAVFGMALLAAGAPASAQPVRPAITSVSHLAITAADPAKSEAFYVHDLGAVKRPDPEDPAGARYYFSPIQFVEVLPLPAGSGVKPPGPCRLQCQRCRRHAPLSDLQGHRGAAQDQ